MNPNKQSQDKRVIATKKNLLHALITLLEEKSIEEVTVRELTGRAKVNRGTFYLHYVDKHDLLEKNIDALILELQDKRESHHENSFIRGNGNGIQAKDGRGVHGYLQLHQRKRALLQCSFQRATAATLFRSNSTLI